MASIMELELRPPAEHDVGAIHAIWDTSYPKLESVAQWPLQRESEDEWRRAAKHAEQLHHYVVAVDAGSDRVLVPFRYGFD